MFEPSAQAAMSFKLSIPWVAVSEAGESPEVSLDDLPVTVPFGRYRIRILGWTANQGRTAEHHHLRVHVRALAAGKDRHLILAEQIFIDGHGVSQALSNSHPYTHVDAQSPTWPPSTIRLKAPMIRVNGPWDLSFTR